MPYAAAAFLALATLLRGAQSPEEAFSEFNRRCVNTLRTGDSTTAVWWLPLEYWRKTAAMSPSKTEAELSQTLDIFRPYLLFGIVEFQGDMAPL